MGSALAQRLRVPFLDADTLHPPANIAKMAAGEPLNDDDRYPWLEKVGEWLAGHRDGGVVACSALKRKYRDQLRAHCPRVEFLHLSGSPELIGRRLAARSGHFMPAALLRSQFDTLEPLGADERGSSSTCDVVQDVEAIVDTFLAESRGPAAAPERCTQSLVALVVALHFVFIGYVVVGGFLALRWPRTMWLHMPAVAWGIAIGAKRVDCPLTWVERWARGRAGMAPLPADGFIAHYITGVIYPASWVAGVQLAAFAVVVASWTLYFRRRRQEADHQRRLRRPS